MERQIILDTETTGLRVEDGHRVIEVGCIEMINRKLTGQYFHAYINPEREVDAGAMAVHGITNAFLKDKPFFVDIAGGLIKFIADAELIIHNAPFDLGFMQAEIARLNHLGHLTTLRQCKVIDTLQIARKLHVGQKNTLDALCKRYSVDLSKRELHGALLDANLLAQVYLSMTGGQGNFFEDLAESSTQQATNRETLAEVFVEKNDLYVLNASDEELTHHKAHLDLLNKQAKCIWLELDVPTK
jgi:DNA polymerase III subunit epsilon